MAYMSQEKKKELAPAIKAVLKKYNMKGSLSVEHYSVLHLNIRSGPIDFGFAADRQYAQINAYHFADHYEGDAAEFLKEVIPLMNIGNYDNSDIMTDYFDVGWYVRVNVGKWDKPYVIEK